MNFKLATFFGVPLKINLLTLLFIVFIYFTMPELFPHYNLFAIGVFCVMLVFIVLHEYGHCLMAKKLGWKVEDITLYPIGGVARIHFKHMNPMEEILVVAAGPAVNVVLAMIFATGMITTFLIDQNTIELIMVFLILTTMNITIFAFNVLPVFPMDGGRILRAILSYKLGHKNATWWAVKTGQVLGIFLIILSLCYGFYFTALLLGFILFKAQEEITAANTIALLQNIRIKISKALDNPNLEKCDLPDLIAVLETIDNEEMKQDLALKELIPLFKGLHEEGVAI